MDMSTLDKREWKPGSSYLTTGNMMLLTTNEIMCAFPFDYEEYISKEYESRKFSNYLKP